MFGGKVINHKSAQISKEQRRETMSLAAFYSANSKTNLDFAGEFVLIGNGSGQKSVAHDAR